MYWHHAPRDVNGVTVDILFPGSAGSAWEPTAPRLRLVVAVDVSMEDPLRFYEAEPRVIAVPGQSLGPRLLQPSP